MFRIFLCLLVCLLSFQCKKENTQKEIIQNHADSIQAEGNSNARMRTDGFMVEDDTVQGAWFKVKVPKGFHALPSVHSLTATENYDSYFYSSPDGKVKFYIYSPQWTGNPNDIVFPNEKIKVETAENNDGSITRTWTLRPNRQNPFIRTFTERKSENSVLITGFYYKDEAAFNEYKDEFEEFNSSVVQFAD